MKKLKILFMVLISTVLLSSCASKSNEVEQLYGKRYGAVGSGISVMKFYNSHYLKMLLLKIMQKKMCLVDILIILKL